MQEKTFTQFTTGGKRDKSASKEFLVEEKVRNLHFPPTLWEIDACLRGKRSAQSPLNINGPPSAPST